jgi:alkylation response protein AidB-like acyl-CoA dehydrogenase
MLALTDELALFGESVRRFAEAEIEPHLDGLCSGTVEAVPLLRDLAAAVGLGDGTEGTLALSLAMDSTPPAQLAASFLLMKELARTSAGMALVLGGSMGLVGGGIAATGTRDQIERWVGPLQRLESVGAWCLTEPDAGSDAFGAMRTRAVTNGESFVVKGSKTYISNAPLADVFLVYAKVTGGPDDGEVRAFVLDRDVPGVSTGPALAKMGAEESPISEVFLDDVPAGPDRLLGGPGAVGREAVKRAMSEERGALPAIALGIAERAYDIALTHARQREQFGRPIGQFQAVQLRLARMAIAVENCRHWVDRLVTGPRTPALACLAKAYTAEAAVDVASGAMHVLGGLGYLRDGRVEKLARDARILEVGAGTTDINLLTAARSDLGFA